MQLRVILLLVKYALWYSISMIDYIIQSLNNYISQGWHMSPVILVLVVGICIQWTKIIIDIIKYRTFYWHNFFSSGWFPSFHTWLASSVAMLVLLENGVDSMLFMVVFSFGLLFAYDAMNIRYEAGQHASYINVLRHELQNVLVKDVKKPPLKERIGHTPIEVMWGVVFGSVLTLILYYFMYIR